MIQLKRKNKRLATVVYKSPIELNRLFQLFRIIFNSDIQVVRIAFNVHLFLRDSIIILKFIK